jgi:hypothetical protein
VTIIVHYWRLSRYRKFLAPAKQLPSSGLFARIRRSLPLQHLLHALRIQFSFPFSDNDCCDSGAEKIRQGTGFGHEPVNAEDQGNAGDADVAYRAEGGGEDDEPVCGILDRPEKPDA